MYRYILSIFNTQLNVVWSWGFHNPNPIENGIGFQVQGFKFKGYCEVKYDEGKDSFTFLMYNSDNTILKTVEDCYFDNLVQVIDSEVETDLVNNKYKRQVGEWLQRVMINS